MSAGSPIGQSTTPTAQEVQIRLYLRSGAGASAQSEKDAELAQKLGQLQPFLAVFPQ